MSIDITALYCCLDDFCKVYEEWEQHKLIPSDKKRRRPGKLSLSEMLLIMVLFHLSPYKHFKAFYLVGIGQVYRSCFVELPHYDRFVSLTRLEQCANLTLWNHKKSYAPAGFWVLNDSFPRFR